NAACASHSDNQSHKIFSSFRANYITLATPNILRWEKIFRRTLQDDFFFAIIAFGCGTKNFRRAS
ncbi:MAG: hypothetical protein IKD80_01065, partial [Selenomonadaceae bacterium]|nr:hypothetical protein [Selenomonadaceae bacterium]